MSDELTGILKINVSPHLFKPGEYGKEELSEQCKSLLGRLIEGNNHEDHA